MELLLFLVTAAVALIGATAMVASRNAVHSALFLLLNFAALAVLFLLLRAPFLFAIQLSIYAGAIMVLFLFVVMILGTERVEDETDMIPWQKPLALVLGLVLFLELVVVSMKGNTGHLQPDAATLARVETFGAPTEIGTVLFTTYLLPFEITGIILLVAVVGVVVLNRGRQQLEQQEKDARISSTSASHETTEAAV
jgi:NADH-quinone oxidoreductase subunit J